MDSHPDKTIYIPPWRSSEDLDGMLPQIQMNPQAAVAKSAAATMIDRQALATAGMLVVLAVFLFINFTSVMSPQNASSVRASVNFRHSFLGTVTAVDTERNAFTVSYESSQDERIISANASSWTVSLPPGSSFKDAASSKKALCFDTPDLTTVSTVKDGMPCAEAVAVGNKILVEYLLLSADKASIVAKTIIVQR